MAMRNLYDSQTKRITKKLEILRPESVLISNAAGIISVKILPQTQHITTKTSQTHPKPNKKSPIQAPFHPKRPSYEAYSPQIYSTIKYPHQS